MATAGIISKLVGFSFDERPFCDLMNPEIRLQENYFYVDSDRCLKSPRLSRTNKNQCPWVVNNTEVACETEIYSFHPVLPRYSYATVPIQGVGHWNSLRHTSFWWHHNYELWYLVSHSFYKHKVRPQLITRSSWSAYLPTLTAPKSFQQDICSSVVRLHLSWL